MKTNLKSIYFFLLLAAFLVSCATSRMTVTGNHENLRRYDNPDINEIIISGWNHVYRENYEWGGMDFTRLIQKKYIDDDILFGAGIACYYQGIFQEAEKYFSRAIDKNPDHFEAVYYRARTYLNIGKKALAERDFQRILDLKYTEPLVCGLYFAGNDIASENMLKLRKDEARRYLEDGTP